MSDEPKVFNDAVELIDFISQHEEIRNNFEKNFDAVWSNLKGMRFSLKRKPCGCGGVNPNAVIAERKNNLENFYKTWLASLENDEIQILKSSLDHDAILKSGDEILLEI